MGRVEEKKLCLMIVKSKRIDKSEVMRNLTESKEVLFKKENEEITEIFTKVSAVLN